VAKKNPTKGRSRSPHPGKYGKTFPLAKENEVELAYQMLREAVLMALKGTGHGLSTEDKVTAIVVDYFRKRCAVKAELEVERIQPDSIAYNVIGHYRDDRGGLHQFMVRVDRDGNVVEV